MHKHTKAFLEFRQWQKDLERTRTMLRENRDPDFLYWEARRKNEKYDGAYNPHEAQKHVNQKVARRMNKQLAAELRPIFPARHSYKKHQTARERYRR